jgi:hypothetical protein
MLSSNMEWGSFIARWIFRKGRHCQRMEWGGRLSHGDIIELRFPPFPCDVRLIIESQDNRSTARGGATEYNCMPIFEPG